MKKILFFIPTLGGGGAEKVLVNLVNNLDRTKYDITVQTLFDYGVNKKYLKNDVKYRTIFKRVFKGNIHILKLFTPQFLFKKMISEHYDIVISYLEGPTTRIVSGCIDKNTKIINWVHTEMKQIKEFRDSFRTFKEMKESYNKYDATVFVANATQENFKKYTKFNLKNEMVIRNAINIEEILKKSQEKIEVKKDSIVLVTLARLTKSKGYDRLLRIHKRLLSDGIENKLWILGEGKERENIEKYIKDNQLEQTVTLYGYQENPYKYLNKADIYVCSSHIEGYSTAVTEALIVGKPIVTTQCSGMNEILDNGKYGMIVENDEEKLYDGIRKMIVNKELRKKYQKLTIERRKHFDIKSQLKQVEHLFENC